ncbi:hypothetical protein HETIRDRAFT_421398 [Heterobasidion irregulare TC 32-1]|uniref:Uncharacterized protein n=1 Tax=Heterobasidion irregulare (strain TC 32-1) TaxID=747525 RepID=W4JWI9_HETIT|nr:uncharacterized protein HETIRDRAFT_421398 [Heterobasidion irregulare TC 32-1]ETW77251.1 hypothetical protein HETIRDRAFT_421398 [Heterobasidion irregulare TC 32-1]
MDVLQSLPANLSVSAPPDVPSGKEAGKRVLHARIKELKDQVEELQTRVRWLETLLKSGRNEHEGTLKVEDTKIDSATQGSLQGNLGGRVKSEEEEEAKQSLISARKSTRTIKKRKMFDPTADEPMPRRRRSSMKVKTEDGDQKYIKVDDDCEQEKKPHLRSRRLKVEVVMPRRSRPRVKSETPIDVDTIPTKAENYAVKMPQDEGIVVGVLKTDASTGLDDVRADTVPVIKPSTDMEVDVSSDQPSLQQEFDFAHQPNMELIAAHLEPPVVTLPSLNLAPDEIDPNDIEVTDVSGASV